MFSKTTFHFFFYLWHFSKLTQVVTTRSSALSVSYPVGLSHTLDLTVIFCFWKQLLPTVWHWSVYLENARPMRRIEWSRISLTSTTFSGLGTVRSCNRLVSTIGSESKRSFNNSTTALAKTITINKADFTAHLPWICCVNDLWQEDRDVLPDDATENKVKH